MRWYVNDVSLQGQFANGDVLESLFRQLIAERARSDRLRVGFYLTRLLPERPVNLTVKLRTMLLSSRSRDFRGAALSWLDRNGPFVDDDRAAEMDDYFEFENLDVTDTALGEAARRQKRNEPVSTFSFVGGEKDFAKSPLVIEQGLAEHRQGIYPLNNLWTIDDLRKSVLDAGPSVTSWRMLVESARERFPYLILPDYIYTNSALSKEAFDFAVRDRALELLSILNEYVMDRGPNREDGPHARYIIEQFFTGERARFSGESTTNKQQFERELSFVHPTTPGAHIFAHWHGKISRRFFRLHFEWPLSKGSSRLAICYLGPKITRS
jgi:hypothetical protein